MKKIFKRSKQKSEATTAKQAIGRAPRRSQVERTEATRAGLIAAAQTVFSRVGFEAARIEDIASEAGRTRGAFYANFDGKAEIFLALRALRFRQRRLEVEALLSGVRGSKARENAIARYLLAQLQDLPGLLLQLEFKLFAIRHPEMRAQLAQRHLDASAPGAADELLKGLSPQDQSPETQHRRILAVEALLEGFAVNASFSPDVFDPDALTEFVSRLAPTLLHGWLGDGQGAKADHPIRNQTRSSS